MVNFLLLSARRLILAFGYKLKRAFLLPVKPRYLHFLVTYQCNARCLMCHIWQRYLKDKGKVKKELNLADLDKFFSENQDWLANLRHIGISGGEPFLRKDLPAIIRLIHQKLPWVSIGIQTNGLSPDLIARKVKEILKFYPQLTIAVSLDGIGEIHDRIRGVKNAYQQVLRTVDLVKKLGVKEVTAGMTISPTNHQQILAVKKVVEGFGGEFSCFLVDESEHFGNKGKKLVLGKKAQKVVISALKNFSYHYYMDNLRLMLAGKRQPQLPCYSGWTSIVLNPYGEILPCILRSESFGNIKKQTLKEILSSKRTRLIRQKIKKCRCWAQCEVSTSAVVDPWDVVKWFLFYAPKKEFLKKMLPNLKRIS